MKKLFLISFLVVSAAVLGGCAAPANVGGMSAAATPQQRIANTPLRNSVAVRDVTGGKDTNPMWTSQVGNSEFEQALEASLKDAGLLANGKQAGKYTLTAQMEKIDQPFAGFNMTVTATVNYILVDRATGKTVLERRIALPYTATLGAAFAGYERLRLASEGAMKTNIAKIIEELFAMNATSLALN
jgi:uncharacterized lipoprotein YbaY